MDRSAYLSGRQSSDVSLSSVQQVEHHLLQEDCHSTIPTVSTQSQLPPIQSIESENDYMDLPLSIGFIEQTENHSKLRLLTNKQNSVSLESFYDEVEARARASPGES